MRVGFFHVSLPGKPDHLELARRMVASVRRAMPRVDVVQFAHGERDDTLGVPVQLQPEQPIALAVLEAYASVDGEWLFLDTDVLVQRDVQAVFQQPFDIALATREGTLRSKEIGTKFMARMPFNKGAVFSRSQAFWKAAAARLRELSPKAQAWMGDQQAMNDVIAGGAFSVLQLLSAFNYPPFERTEDVRDQAILHFKGPRKRWMLERAA